MISVARDERLQFAVSGGLGESMIVRQVGEHILLITQPDHAHLSGRIMSHAVALRDHPRRDAILLAVREHDAGWALEDANPHVDPALGTILDFVHAASEGAGSQ